MSCFFLTAIDSQEFGSWFGYYALSCCFFCNILTFDRAVNQETGASGRGCRRCHLDLWTGWIQCTCDAHGKQVGVKQLYNQVPQTVGVSWSSRQWEPAPDWGLVALSDPRLSSSAEWERSAAIVRGTWGQYVAVCSVSNSPLTHNPFANKVWEVYFSKEVCSSIIIVMFPHIYVYV